MDSQPLPSAGCLLLCPCHTPDLRKAEPACLLKTAPSHEYSARQPVLATLPQPPLPGSSASSRDHLVNLSSGAKTLQMFAQPPLSVNLQRLFSVGLCPPLQRHCYGGASSRAGPELTNDLAGGEDVFLRERDRLLYLSRFRPCKMLDGPQVCLTVKFIHPTRYFCAAHQNVQMSRIISKFSSPWVLFFWLEQECPSPTGIWRNKSA